MGKIGDFIVIDWENIPADQIDGFEEWCKFHNFRELTQFKVERVYKNGDVFAGGFSWVSGSFKWVKPLTIDDCM